MPQRLGDVAMSTNLAAAHAVCVSNRADANHESKRCSGGSSASRESGIGAGSDSGSVVGRTVAASSCFPAQPGNQDPLGSRNGPWASSSPLLENLSSWRPGKWGSGRAASTSGSGFCIGGTVCRPCIWFWTRRSWCKPRLRGRSSGSIPSLKN